MENENNVRLFKVHFLGALHPDIRPYNFLTVYECLGRDTDEEMILTIIKALKVKHGLKKSIFCYEKSGVLYFGIFDYGISRIIRKIRFKLFFYTHSKGLTTDGFKVNFCKSLISSCVDFFRFFMHGAFHAFKRLFIFLCYCLMSAIDFFFAL